MTTNSTVSQRVEFDCSYLVKNTGKYGYTLQGCRYLVEATVKNNINEDSAFVIEFKQLRAHLVASVPDNAFLFYHGDPLAQHIAAELDSIGVAVKAYSNVVSAEIICETIAMRLQSLLDSFNPGVLVVEVKLKENSDSFATYRPSV